MSAGPLTHNNLGWCLTALVGAYIPGPGIGYLEAIAELQKVLATYRVLDQPGAIDIPDGWTTVEQLAQPVNHLPIPPERHLDHPALRSALGNLGNVYRLRKEFQRSLDCYAAVIHLKPDFLDARGDRAWVHLDCGDTASAEQAMEDILRMESSPEDASAARAHKAKILTRYLAALERVGLPEKRQAWQKRAIELGIIIDDATT